MQLAFIAPTSLLSRFCQPSAVQMCLAHQVLNDLDYGDFYANVAVEDGRTVIMDNSLMELGSAMDFDRLWEACERVRPDELIVPDVFRDGLKTTTAFHEFLNRVEVVPAEDRPWQRNFVVVHGKDREEWLNCFDALNEHPEAHVLGLPKVLDEVWSPGGRLGAAEFLECTQRIRTDKQYHCLGIWTDPIEILLLSRFKWIRSLDTALPIHAGMQGVKFDPELGLSRDRPRRPHIYFEVPYNVVATRVATIQYNVVIALEWAQSDGRYRPLKMKGAFDANS